MLQREHICQKESKEDQVLEEGLHVGQVNRLTEAAAVHLGIEDDKNQSKQREESLQADCNLSNDAFPYSGNECCADQGLGKGEKRTHYLRGEGHEIQMHE